MLAAASELKLNVISSQPLLQGYVSDLPLSRESVPGPYNLAARHLQLIRSIPSKAMKSTLVGMKQNEHVRANLEVTQKPLLTREEFFAAMGPHRRLEYIDEEMIF